MRGGVHVRNGKRTCEILLAKVKEGNVIISNETVKSFLTDLITLHEEVERYEEQLSSLRDAALPPNPTATATRRGERVDYMSR